VRRVCSRRERALLSPLLKDNDFAASDVRIRCGPYRSLVLQQMRCDAALLRSLQIMDYSLVLAVQHSTPIAAPAAAPAADAAADAKAVPPPLPPSALPLLWSRPHFVLETADTADGGGVSCSMAIIDVLQRYTIAKKMETLLKGLFVDKSKLSSVDPAAYADRFIASVEKHFIE
jgi:hypothetical protein